jgi:hypothetical protein
MESTSILSTSTKLPSILMMNSYYDHVVVSPPLTPAVSPSTMLMDSSNTDNLYNNNNYAYSTYSSSMNSPISSHDQSTTNTAHKHICHFNFCGWSFKRYEHLKRHMLVHTGERPHTCRYPGCGKSFSRSDNFHAHYRTHTKKKTCATKRKSAAVTTVSAAVTNRVTESANQQRPHNFLTSIATTAAVVAVSQQQLQQNQQVFYNSHLYDGRSTEVTHYYWCGGSNNIINI